MMISSHRDSAGLSEELRKIHEYLSERINRRDYTFRDLYTAGKYNFTDLYEIISDHASNGIFLETYIQYHISRNDINNPRKGFFASVEHKTFSVDSRLPSCSFIFNNRYIPVFEPNTVLPEVSSSTNNVQSYASLKEIADMSINKDNNLRKKAKFLGFLIGSEQAIFEPNYMDIAGNISKVFSLKEDSVFVLTPTKIERWNNSRCDLNIHYLNLPGHSENCLCIDLRLRKSYPADPSNNINTESRERQGYGGNQTML